MWWTVHRIGQAMTTSSVLDQAAAPKHFPKPNLHQKRVMVVCCWPDPLQLSESWWIHYIWEVCSANWWDAPKTAMSAAGTGQQKGPNSSPRQLPTTHCTTNATKVEPAGLWSFTSSAIFTWPLTNHHFLKHLNNFLQGKCFHNQQDAENAFQEFTESQSMDFYTTGKDKPISHWQKCVDWMVSILINKNLFETS